MVLLRPNLLRALWVTFAVGGAFALLTASIRAATGLEPTFQQNTLLTVGWIAGSIGFLIGIGAFDYWARWMVGSPTRPEDHSQHGARSWRDYFRFNTDHKVIGVQYVVGTLIFFLIGGFFALIMRAELARPGVDVIDEQTYNGMLSQHGR